MKKYKLLIIIFLAMLVFTSCIAQKSSIKNNAENIQNNKDEKMVENDNFKIYKNEKYNFTVEYPIHWKVSQSEEYDGNEEHEGSPDDGISIYVESDESEKIYIFGQSGKVSAETPNCEKKDFTTDSGTKGVLFITESNDRYMMHLVLDGEFHGVAINLSKECYDKNKEQVIRILKSIRIL